MRVKVTLPITEAENLREGIVEKAEVVEEENKGESTWEAVSTSQFSPLRCLLMRPC